MAVRCTRLWNLTMRCSMTDRLDNVRSSIGDSLGPDYAQLYAVPRQDHVLDGQLWCAYEHHWHRCHCHVQCDAGQHGLSRGTPAAQQACVLATISELVLTLSSSPQSTPTLFLQRTSTVFFAGTAKADQLSSLNFRQAYRGRGLESEGASIPMTSIRHISGISVIESKDMPVRTAHMYPDSMRILNDALPTGSLTRRTSVSCRFARSASSGT